MSYGKPAEIHVAPTIWNCNFVSCRVVQNIIESTSSQELAAENDFGERHSYQPGWTLVCTERLT